MLWIISSFHRTNSCFIGRPGWSWNLCKQSLRNKCFSRASTSNLNQDWASNAERQVAQSRCYHCYKFDSAEAVACYLSPYILLYEIKKYGQLKLDATVRHPQRPGGSGFKPVPTKEKGANNPGNLLILLEYFCCVQTACFSPVDVVVL